MSGSWHCVWLDQTDDGWEVWCHPHGFIASHPAHLAAFEAALAHDWENGTCDLGQSEP